MSHPILDPDGRLRERVEAIKTDFLANRWEAYMEKIRRVEAHPENRDGADKTWVFEATAAYRSLIRNARRVD